jgi:L,D-transpeptidase YcbB
MRLTASVQIRCGRIRIQHFYIFCLLLLPLTVAAQGNLQPLLQRLSAEGVLQIAGANIRDLQVTQEVYANAAYAPLWTNPDALGELASSIEQAGLEGMNPDDYHQTQVQALADGSLSLDVATRDLLLTDSLVRLTYHYALGKLEPKDLASSWNFKHKVPEIDPVDWLGQVTEKGGIAAGLANLKPVGPMYANLVAALARYRALAAAGGWEAVAEGPTLRRGESGPRIVQLRRRLQAEGDLTAGTVSRPDYFDESLEQAVTQFQRRHRLDTDGAVGKKTLAALNVPVEQRIGQILVNLERARVLQDIPPTAVIVDIAGFEVSYFRDGRRLLRSRAQVGKPFRTTPVFGDSIRYVVFNPTWTVPPSILVNDVLPAVKRDPGYLASRNMQVLTMAGEVVNPASVNWRAYPARGFPYMIRQRPGPNNALGRIKVMFPNEHMVYLHDTPSKDLFNRSERTFSSGCIRVEKIEQLVELLLDEPQRWDRAAIDAAVDSLRTRKVSLPTPVPIYLVYWTVEVEEDGAVHFKHDPYDQDPRLIKALQQPLVPDGSRVSRSRQRSS